MQTNMNCFFIATVTEHELDTIIRNMNNKTSVDVYNISMKFIKEIRHCILSQLCKLINISFISGVFPDCLKKASVHPVFKQGDIHSFTNYRPISLLPQISKIVEKCFEVRLTSFLNKHKIIAPEQYGFRENLSTEMALVDFVETIARGMAKKNTLPPLL